MERKARQRGGTEELKTVERESCGREGEEKEKGWKVMRGKNKV